MQHYSNNVPETAERPSYKSTYEALLNFLVFLYGVHWREAGISAQMQLTGFHYLVGYDKDMPVGEAYKMLESVISSILDREVEE